MRLQVEKNGVVTLDGVTKEGVDVAALPGNATGLVWFNSEGELPEGSAHHAGGELYVVEAGKALRIPITDFAPYQSIVDAFNAPPAEEAPAP